MVYLVYYQDRLRQFDLIFLNNKIFNEMNLDFYNKPFDYSKWQPFNPHKNWIPTKFATLYRKLVKRGLIEIENFWTSGLLPHDVNLLIINIWFQSIYLRLYNSSLSLFFITKTWEKELLLSPPLNQVFR